MLLPSVLSAGDSDTGEFYCVLFTCFRQVIQKKRAGLHRLS